MASSAFASALTFLHSLRQLEYLKQALREGLRFTTHNVKFRPAADETDWRRLLGEVWPLLLKRLEQIGAPWESLSEERRRTLMSGLGAVKAPIPMLCFTEVPEGRLTDFHQYQFGYYGIFIRRTWLERNGADRVLYPVRRALFRTLRVNQA